jgi:Protein of unknown function (DUF1236)
MRSSIGIVACGLVFLSGTAPSVAQTTVTRQITNEAVETTTTRGPNGTMVTRRVLDPAAPVPNVWTAPPVEYVPNYSAPVAAQEVDEPETVTVRRERRSTVRTDRGSTAVTTRTQTRRQVVRGQGGGERLVLSPTQRQIVYRTIIRREVYPSVVAQTEVVAPPARTYPLTTVYPFRNDNAYYDDRYAYRPYDEGYTNGGYGYDRYAARTVYPTATYPTNYVVGSRLPERVPLVAVPESVSVQVPATRTYSYATINGRVYLVDPATNVIVADVTQ